MATESPAERHVLLYVTNVVLLATHQVDAAYWHEWSVFGVPGGIEGFLVFNVLALAVLQLGLVRVAQRRASARAFTIACAGTGGLTVGLHAVFLVRDRVAFWTAPSLLLLVAIAIVTLAQCMTLPPPRVSAGLARR